MNVDTIHAFRQATVSVLESYGFSGVRLEEVLVCPETCSRSAAVGVAVGLSGGLSGQLGFVFSRDQLPGFVGQVVRAPIAADQVQDQHDIATEFANIVAGHAMGQLYGMGMGVDISPPILAPGPEVLWSFPEDAESVVVPVVTDQGRVEVVLSVFPS